MGHRTLNFIPGGTHQERKGPEHPDYSRVTGLKVTCLQMVIHYTQTPKPQKAPSAIEYLSKDARAVSVM